jgi:hypothetical protein
MARRLDDGKTLEVMRVYMDGRSNRNASHGPPTPRKATVV